MPVRDQERDRLLAPATLRMMHGQNNPKAAHQQHDRVDAADHPVELCAGRSQTPRGYRYRYPAEAGGNKGAEEHHFGRQEHPHSQRRGLSLLLEVGVLLLEAIWRTRIESARALPLGVKKREYQGSSWAFSRWY